MKRIGLTGYITEALKRAVYEYCDQTRQWCAYVQELPGCWATGETVEHARQELRDVVEGWLMLSLQAGDPITDIQGHTLGNADKHVSSCRCIVKRQLSVVLPSQISRESATYR